MNLECQDVDGWTALLAASQNGHLKVVQSLIEAGADMKACTKDGLSCLAMACQNGQHRLAKFLLEVFFIL